MRVAVIGAGISGLAAATVLSKAGVEVVLYEKEDYLGGLARTTTVDGVDLDLSFMVFNPVTSPNMMEFFESLGVDMESSPMSFSVSLDNGKGYEWGSRNGLSSLFTQKMNVFNPFFWKMVREVIKFKDDATRYLEEFENNTDIDRSETLEQFIKLHGYSELFQKAYLVPICASILLCSSDGLMSSSAHKVLTLCRNHHFFQLCGHPQWLTVKGGSCNYINIVREALARRGCQIKISSKVLSVTTISIGDEVDCVVTCEDGSQEVYNGSIVTVRAPGALDILHQQAIHGELRILGAFQYGYSDVFLHRDKSLMPRNSAAWSSWNFLGTVDNKACLTYWLNELQNLGAEPPYLVTFNPPHTPEDTLLKWSIAHPIPSVAASKASLELEHIQGKRGIWFCGVHQGYGVHEDGLKAGLFAAHAILGKSCAIRNNPKCMVPSLIVTGARYFLTRFLRSYISVGCLILLEEGGTVFNFEGNTKVCHLKASIKVHSPQFYWKEFSNNGPGHASASSQKLRAVVSKDLLFLNFTANVATQADLGLADAYVNGDFSMIDDNEGLLNLFMILIANRDLKTSFSKTNSKRGWWTPLLLTAGIASARGFFQHVSRQNTLTQARRNISRHYDLSNEVFSLFLDETMTYSSGLFESEDEDLKVAQMRKISILIKKARIDKNHEILEIGSGWGSFAIEVVKQTGCKYTGITLSEEQLKYAEIKVKEAGLEDHIRFLLCDYRQLPATYKYDRIISCEMIEHVGHEYFEEFFKSCESVLDDNGLLVLQFISIPDDRYDEYRRSSDFIKEYIFPGGCLPSLSRITTAMAASSRLCVENLENIGIHYYPTLRCWRRNFLVQQKKIKELGYDDKFIRTWEYYFDYCASGFKTRTLGDYQVVFSRPGNVLALGSPSSAD